MTAATLQARYVASPWLPWAAAIAAFVLLFFPTWWTLAGGLWTSDDYSNGPLVGVVAAWLFWRERIAILEAPSLPKRYLGGAILTGGVLLAIGARMMMVPEIGIAAQIPVIAGTLLLVRGAAALRVAWFPLLFLVFMVPLPASILGPLTATLKEWIAVLAEGMLYEAGLPVARRGVAIDIGQYRLFVADACAGLHSMLSLSALGALFIYLSGRASILHNVVMVASIVPIAFVANLFRVLILLLVTYYAGDSTARWLHGAAGLSVFIAEIGLLFALDHLLARRRLASGTPT